MTYTAITCVQLGTAISNLTSSVVGGAFGPMKAPRAISSVGAHVDTIDGTFAVAVKGG